jgi:RimJ/RimL family protein N-acetyltransferase
MVRQLETKLTDYTIRAATKEDAESYKALRLRALKNNPEAFGSSYEERSKQDIEFFRQRIPEENSDNLLLFVEKDSNLVGMMGFLRVNRLKQNHNAFIWGVYIDPEARGNGLGRKMMAQIMNHARQIEGLRQVQLSVVTSNSAALKLYQSFGFTIWGTEPEALKVGDKFYDEYYMVCHLTLTP